MAAQRWRPPSAGEREQGPNQSSHCSQHGFWGGGGKSGGGRGAQRTWARLVQGWQRFLRPRHWEEQRQADQRRHPGSVCPPPVEAPSAPRQVGASLQVSPIRCHAVRPGPSKSSRHNGNRFTCARVAWDGAAAGTAGARFKPHLGPFALQVREQAPPRLEPAMRKVCPCARSCGRTCGRKWHCSGTHCLNSPPSPLPRARGFSGNSKWLKIKSFSRSGRRPDWFRALGLPADGKTPAAGTGPGGWLTSLRPVALHCMCVSRDPTRSGAKRDAAHRDVSRLGK